MRHIALLRGINVGGKNSLPMRALTLFCTDLGAANVRTYIQSGNVGLDLPPPLPATFARDLQARIARELGLTVPVVLRTLRELQLTLQHNPWPALDPGTVHVAFLRDQPTAEQVARLEPDRSPPDTFLVRGSDVYLHTPGGLARSKLTNAWLDARLGTTATIRNWRTVVALAKL